MPGVGGGGGGGGDPISKAVTKVAEATTAVVTDPVGTTTGAINDTITTAGESFEPVVGGVENILDQTGAALEEGLSTGVESMGMNDGVATTLGDFGDKLNEGFTSFGDKIVDDNLETWINEGVDKVHDFGKDVNDVVSDEMGRWEDYVQEKLGAGGSSGSTVELDKLSSFKANKLKKIKADLGSNKAKSRARSSLRIG